MKVWAPLAKKVEVELVGSGTRLPMKDDGDGHFSIAPPQGAYQLRLDGSDPIPDPRAEDVESVNGPCHWVDHTAFQWTDSQHRCPTLERAVLYELHVGTFSPEGTFDGALAKLPLLVELGVTHVELMPVATFSGNRGWGYDGAAMFAPHRAYGGVEGLKRLVDGAHRLGLGVLLDVVYNHLGPIGNYLGRFGPFFQEDRHTPWGAAVNFDGPGSHEVRRFFLDNALHWLKNYHFDGLRLDAVHAIHDESAIHFLEQLSTEVAKLEHPKLLIAESDLNDPRVIRPREQHGFGMDAQWSDDLHHALHAALTGERHTYYSDFDDALPALGRALDEGYVYQGQHSKHRMRLHGRPLGEVPLKRLISFLQNHDQTGNRAVGERLHHLSGHGRTQAGLALLMLSPQVPMLFQGEEWAASTPFQFFTDHQDPQVAKATTEGRRREIGDAAGPDPQAQTTFDASRLKWDERSREPHARMLGFVKALIALRKTLDPDLRGRSTVSRETLTYQRGPIVIAINLGKARYGIPLLPGIWIPAVPLLEGARLGSGVVELGPDCFAVLSKA